MDMEYIKAVCKIGQGAECCRYLTAGPRGFQCEKKNVEMKRYLDLRVEAGRMNSKGDNCEGK